MHEGFNMLERVIEVISMYQGVDKKDITSRSLLTKDLGLTSYDVIGLVGRFEDEFDIDIPDRKIKSLKTVDDVVRFIEALL